MTMVTRATGALVALCLLLGGLLVAPASADNSVRVSASVTSPGPFVVGDREVVPIRFTVTNTGTEERRLWGSARTLEGSPFSVGTWTWGDLNPWQGGGAVFAPGETRTYNLAGRVSHWAGQPRIMIGVTTSPHQWVMAASTELTLGSSRRM